MKISTGARSLLLAACAQLTACAEPSLEPGAPDATAEGEDAATAPPEAPARGPAGPGEAALAGAVEVNILYVHGVKNCDGSRRNAQNSLNDLDAAVKADLPARVAAYEAAHPGVTLAFRSAHANLYTATPSGFHPSDSTDPVLIDDWEAGDPGCSAAKQGEPCTTAYEWRHRLVQEINRAFPAGAKNVILVGHSTGARTAFEVAANVGPGGVNTHDWGVQSRVAGVVSVQGMVDSLGTSKYDVAGPASFVTTCKNGEPVVGFGDSCAPGNGWCEYAGDVSGFAAADWVTQNKRALMLTSFAGCSPSLFSGWTDGSLPYDAQASPLAVGLAMTAAPNQTYRPAHGVRYGQFCHSAITSSSQAGHAQAVASAKARILDWLFVAAPRTAASGAVTTASLGRDQSSATFAMGSSCPAGWVDDTITSGISGKGVEIEGVCKHPGFFDGDDHILSQGELSVSNGPACNGSFRWQQKHDSNKHAATIHWKTRALKAGAPDLIASLSAN